MPQYFTTGTELTSIADAIRAKTGVSNPLTYPSGFVSAISSIEGGGSGSGSSGNEKTVLFFDQLSDSSDPVYSYTPEEFAALTAMPANPDHSQDEIPMTSQGWNWSLEDAKSYVADYDALMVGQTYVPADGCAYYYISANPGMSMSERGVAIGNIAGSGTIYWDKDDSEGTALSESASAYIHYYSDVKSRWVKISGMSSIMPVTDQNSFSNYYKTMYMRNVKLPSGLTSIGSSAFGGCYALTSITLPSGLTDIGANAFANCRALTSITLPSGLTSIGMNAFAYCRALTSITLPSGLTDIGANAFANCTALASITLPSGLTSIGTNAFGGCCALTSITLPSGLTSIGSSAFGGCCALTSITLPSGLTSIGSSAFANCYALTSITLPSGLTSIGTSAFGGCFTLSSITLPSGLTSIGMNAFGGCCALTSITLPSGLTSIGSSAFANCDALKTITVTGSNTHIIASNVFKSIPSDCSFYFPSEYLGYYKSAANWSHFSSRMFAIPE